MTLTDLAAGSGRLKTDLAVGVERWRERVLALSRSLHAHPEVAFGETASSAAITELLAQGGFDVERGTGRLAEYEALPARVRRCFEGAALATRADAPIHSHGFTALADSPEAYRVMFEEALAPAWTIADTATDPPQRKRFATTPHRRNPTQEAAAT
ncbi:MULTISPECIES: hypothetical protein [Streptomyces]|uniref:hypothetical protein n=1 Tax=Streptomyces lycopersici TaxID=2974589 RepID=UPI0021D1AAFC|nr:hypothetical protein [Streptomyces sp. NEAU-383]